MLFGHRKRPAQFYDYRLGHSRHYVGKTGRHGCRTSFPAIPHEKLDACKEFTICIPKDGELTKELAFAGVKSGRAFDKAAELNFRYLPAEKTAVPLLDRCSAAYECRVIYETEMHEAHLDPEIVKRFYREGDYHTLYFGEILACHQF